MKTKFQIECILQEGNKKHIKYFVLARSLEKKEHFSLGDNPTLGGVSVSSLLSQVRALDEEGNPRFDLYVFKICFRRDSKLLKAGDIVELIE